MLVAWNYIKFLRNATQPETITDIHRLKSCFVMETYFVDTMYFKYLMQQTFNNWNALSTVVYNEPNPDIQRRMFLSCPYEFILEPYNSKQSFRGEWLEHNKNTSIVVNGNETYHTHTEYYDNGVTKYILMYHTINEQRVGFRQEIKFYPSGNTKWQKQYFNTKKQGLWRKWYDNEKHTLKEEYKYVNDKLHGTHLEWYDGEHHTLYCKGQYLDDKMQGVWKIYYNNEQQTLWTEDDYGNGEGDGIW